MFCYFQLDYHKSGDVTPASIKRQVQQDVTRAPPVDNGVREIRKKEESTKSRPEHVREWDRDKVRQSRSRSRERAREADRRKSDERSREKSRDQEKKKRERSKETKEKKGT